MCNVYKYPGYLDKQDDCYCLILDLLVLKLSPSLSLCYTHFLSHSHSFSLYVYPCPCTCCCHSCQSVPSMLTLCTNVIYGKQTPAFRSHDYVCIQYCSEAVQCIETLFCFPLGVCGFLLLNKNHGQSLLCLCVLCCVCVCTRVCVYVCLCVCVCVYAWVGA